MKKRTLIINFVIYFLFAFLGLSFAGLIDYEKLKQIRAARKAAAQNPGKPLQPNPDEEGIPSWMITEPKVNNKDEAEYDINRDGKLQTAEVKIFLRDALDTIEEKGGVTINSDILKEYDKNKDGYINKFEATKITEEVR